MVGTTTNVRDSGGMPFEKSSRGNGKGFVKSVTSQFTKDIDRWLQHKISKKPNAQICQLPMPPIWAFAKSPQHKAKVNSADKPK